MVKAQEYIEKNYPSKENTKEIYVRRQNLEGHLDLREYKNLEKLDLILNKVTSLDLQGLNKLWWLWIGSNKLNKLNLQDQEKCLTHLHISDNNFPEQDLSAFGNLVNLQDFRPGNYESHPDDRTIYNKFFGSLKPLKNMNKLNYLYICNTNINSGLEYLPNSVGHFYHGDDYMAVREETKGSNKFAEQLSPFNNNIGVWRNANADLIAHASTDFQSKNIPQGIQTGNVFTSPLTIKSIRKLRQDEHGMENYEINAPYEIEVAEDVTHENGTSKFIRFFAHADNDNSNPATYNLNAHILYYFLANLDNTVQIPLWNKCLINGQTVYAIRGTPNFLQTINREIVKWENYGYDKNDLIGLVSEHERFMLNDQNRRATSSMIQKRSTTTGTQTGKTLDLTREHLNFSLNDQDWPLKVEGMHIRGIRRTMYLKNGVQNFTNDLWTVLLKEDDEKKVTYPDTNNYEHLIIKNTLEGDKKSDPFYYFASNINNKNGGIKVKFVKKDTDIDTKYMVLAVGDEKDEKNKLSKLKTIIQSEKKKWDGLGWKMEVIKEGLTQDNFARVAKEKIAKGKKFSETTQQDISEQQHRIEQQQHPSQTKKS